MVRKSTIKKGVGVQKVRNRAHQFKNRYTSHPLATERMPHKLPQGAFGSFFQSAWGSVKSYFGDKIGQIKGQVIGAVKNWTVDDYVKGAGFLLEQKKKWFGMPQDERHRLLKKIYGDAEPGAEFPEYVRDLVNMDTDDDGYADLFVTASPKEGFIPSLNYDPTCLLTPTLNIDTNQDGHEDMNEDIDGDGVAEVNLDLDGDGIPESNLDVNGNQIPTTNIVPVPEPIIAQYTFHSIQFNPSGHIILDEEVLIIEQCKIELDVEENYMRIYPHMGGDVDPEYYESQLDLTQLIVIDADGDKIPTIIKVLDDKGDPIPSGKVIRFFVDTSGFLSWAKYWEEIVEGGSSGTDDSYKVKDLKAGTNVTLTYDETKNIYTIASSGGSASVNFGSIGGEVSAQQNLYNLIQEKATKTELDKYKVVDLVAGDGVKLTYDAPSKKYTIDCVISAQLPVHKTFMNVSQSPTALFSLLGLSSSRQDEYGIINVYARGTGSVTYENVTSAMENTSATMNASKIELAFSLFVSVKDALSWNNSVSVTVAYFPSTLGNAPTKGTLTVVNEENEQNKKTLRKKK